MEINKKNARDRKDYLVVVDDSGTKYIFSEKDGGYSPSTVGATDEEGLTKACDHLTANGYEVVMGRMRPSGFEYDG